MSNNHDSFFGLGVHSLLVMHLVNKANYHRLNIDARNAFSFPIFKNLSKQKQIGNETPLFMLPDGGEDISHIFELAHDIDENIPVYV